MNKKDNLSVQDMAWALYLEDLLRWHRPSWEFKRKFLGDGLIFRKLSDIETYLDDPQNIFQAFQVAYSPGLRREFYQKALSYYARGLRITYAGQQDWPLYLESIPDKPLWLWFKGKSPAQLNQSSPVAIVGARKMLDYSKYVCRRITTELVARGHPIVSGLALGIDGTAHRSTLDAGGYTLAIMPCGLEECYPRQHQKLFEQIARQGSLLSEFPPHYPLRKANFHYRNRLISGLANTVIIIQAASKSGSLITGRLAAEQMRQVLVVPASIEQKAYQGSLALIRDGAQIFYDYACIEEMIPSIEQSLLLYTKKVRQVSRRAPKQISLEDWEELQPSTADEGNLPLLTSKEQSPSLQLDVLNLSILNNVHNGCNSKNSLAEELNLPISEINIRLSELYLENFLIAKSGNLFLTEKAISCIYYKNKA